MQNIHFKVAMFHNNETTFRRFASNTSSTFAELKTVIASLFNFENLDCWIIQYKDDEDQWVTFSTDEELAFASKLMGNKLNLQLVPKTPQNHHEPRINRACGSDANNVREQPKREDQPKREEQPKADDKLGAKKARLVQQRDLISDKLTALRATENPKVAPQVEKLQQKLNAINTQLDQVEKQASQIAKKQEQNKEKEAARKARLEQQRDLISTKLSALRATANPKVAPQVEKLQQKLDAINSQLGEQVVKQTPTVDIADTKPKDKEAPSSAPLTRHARLVLQRDRITEKLSELKASNNPKVASQVEKLQQKLEATNKLLETTPENPQADKKNKEALKKENIEKRNTLLKEALLKKHEYLCEKISSLRSSDNPKAQAQLSKLEESVKGIDAKLLKLQPASSSEEIPVKKDENSSNQLSVAVTAFHQSALAEAKEKHQTLRLELQTYKAHIGSLSKFLQVLRKSSSKGTNEQVIQQTESFLGLLQAAFSEKKVHVSDHMGVMKMLVKNQQKHKQIPKTVSAKNAEKKQDQ